MFCPSCKYEGQFLPYKNRQEDIGFGASQKLKEKLLDPPSFESVDLKLDKHNALVDIREQSKIEITGAERYTYVDDLWILSSYYNPEKYKTKRYNYETFIERIQKSNLNYLIVECAFGKDE